MTNTQDDAVRLLREVWCLSPEVRLGQLLAHLGYLGEILAGKKLGDIDDDELLAVLDHHLTELQGRNVDTSDECQSDVTSVSGSAT